MNAPEREAEREENTGIMKAIIRAIEERENAEEKWTPDKPCPICGDYCWRTEPFDDEETEEQGEEKR